MKMVEPRIEQAPISDTRRGYLPWPLARVMYVLQLTPLELVANHILAGVLDRHPGIVSRMGEHAAKRFAVDPVDCPFAFILEPGQARLQAVASLTHQSFDARISGPMVVLIGALKSKGLQRGKVYLAATVKTVRAALDALAAGHEPPPGALGAFTQGARETAGAYRKTWR